MRFRVFRATFDNEKGDNLVVNEEIFLEDDLDEDLTNLNYEELLVTKEIKNRWSGRQVIFYCNSKFISNTTVKINVNLSNSRLSGNKHFLSVRCSCILSQLLVYLLYLEKKT